MPLGVDVTSFDATSAGPSSASMLAALKTSRKVHLEGDVGASAAPEQTFWLPSAGVQVGDVELEGSGARAGVDMSAAPTFHTLLRGSRDDGPLATVNLAGKMSRLGIINDGLGAVILVKGAMCELDRVVAAMGAGNGVEFRGFGDDSATAKQAGAYLNAGDGVVIGPDSNGDVPNSLILHVSSRGNKGRQLFYDAGSLADDRSGKNNSVTGQFHCPSPTSPLTEYAGPVACDFPRHYLENTGPTTTPMLVIRSAAVRAARGCSWPQLRIHGGYNGVTPLASVEMYESDLLWPAVDVYHSKPTTTAPLFLLKGNNNRLWVRWKGAAVDDSAIVSDLGINNDVRVVQG